ncbi:hypothetical protein GCM10009584_08370 [Ornithinimicrobium humiphilum]|uniref:Murein DD-endopeptidase MepM/ murein hydrolase activator NlpD n=1 Tax=Ornithinimicrobium humiphilum TaxID=125288 RepID=A0A543KQI8_9MICO|nr:M23 family metallopeptidase [Ornithinimicrobium humiphilum]TQM97349.1 murein DD-endopeptidase MepM/ murein hydrolase activator NlpD [Ornithinimicrobium humiphilum]
MSTPVEPRRRGLLVRHRLRGAVALALAGVVLGGPALASDLTDIREKIREVERKESRTDQQRKDAEKSAKELGHELEHTSSALVAADKRLKETTAKVEAARIVLEEAEADLADAEAEAQRIEAELAIARANEATIEESLEANEAAQADSRATVGAIARDSYKQGGMGSLATTLELLAGESDAVDRMAMARTVLRVQDQQIRALATQEAEAVAEQDRLAGVRQDIAYLLALAEANVVAKEEARAAADAAKQELEALEAQQAEDKAALETEKAKVEAELAAEQARSDELADQLAQLASKKHRLKTEERAEVKRLAEEEAKRKAAAEAKRKAEEEAAKRRAEEEAARQRAAAREAERQRQIADEARRRQDQAAADEAARRAAQAQAEADRAARAEREAREQEAAQEAERERERQRERDRAQGGASSGFLSHPMAGGITSEFGMRLHPILGIYVLHSGIDFGAACGTPVKAAADGAIVSTPYDNSRGNYVVIDHGVQRGVNLTTAYLHLQSFAVSPGQWVSRGQVIGYEGTTGSSTGCHLHFETRENGNPVNPRTWL